MEDVTLPRLLLLILSWGWRRLRLVEVDREDRDCCILWVADDDRPIVVCVDLCADDVRPIQLRLEEKIRRLLDFGLTPAEEEGNEDNDGASLLPR
jgi:hypothetical protein